MSKEKTFSGREIKAAIEKYLKAGTQKLAIIKNVKDMGVEATTAEFLVNLYARKFNQ